MKSVGSGGPTPARPRAAAPAGPAPAPPPPRARAPPPAPGHALALSLGRRPHCRGPSTAPGPTGPQWGAGAWPPSRPAKHAFPSRPHVVPLARPAHPEATLLPAALALPIGLQAGVSAHRAAGKGAPADGREPFPMPHTSLSRVETPDASRSRSLVGPRAPGCLSQLLSQCVQPMQGCGVRASRLEGHCPLQP